jgi:hypothetical protein
MAHMLGKSCNGFQFFITNLKSVWIFLCVCFYYIIVVLGVYCDNYRSSNNIS